MIIKRLRNGRFLTAVTLPLLALTLLFQHVLTVPNNAILPDGSFVVRVYYDEIADIEKLAGFDVWEMNNLAEKYVLVATDQDGYAQIARLGFDVVLQSEAAPHGETAVPHDFFNGYRTVDELYSDLAALESNHPTLATRFVYGESYCKQSGGCTMPDGASNPGYDLIALRITNPAVGNASSIGKTAVVSGTKPVFFLLAGIHSREISTPELAMRMADWLLDGYGTHPDATWLVDHHEIWIVPTANPDGHWIVEQGIDLIGSPLYHRKNSNPNGGCTTWPSRSSNHLGVDLNRNHSHEYGGASTSTQPCSAVFRGTGPTSEPETAALEALVMALISDQRGPDPSDAAPEDTTGIFISLHSYSELILWPWGYTGFFAPNRTGLKAIADKMASYNGYYSCQPASCLYAASGTSDDFAYGTLGIPSFTFEVGTQFLPPYGEIDAEQWPDNGPAFQYAAKLARTPYQLVNGPDVISPTVTLLADQQAILSAVLDDSENGNQPIAALAYTVDAPYWESTAVTQTIPIDPSSGPVESVNTSLDLSTLDPIQHTLFFRAQDSDGNWGPVSAAFIDLSDGGTALLETAFLPLIWNR